jgi:hypothetical protein
MKRIKPVLLAVVALMVTMIVLSASPALAQMMGGASCGDWTWDWYWSSSAQWWYWEWHRMCWDSMGSWTQWGNWGWAM